MRDRLARFAVLLGLGAVVVAGAAGCGSSGPEGTNGSPQQEATNNGSGEKSGSAASAPGEVAWPYFGRVPERTHYLPDENRELDPPLKQAWSVNTHGLIEFPPALAHGVGYVINKYGNGKAVRLSDRKVLWELQLDPSNRGKQSDVTAPTFYKGQVYGAFLDGDLADGDAATGKKVWVRDLHSHLESSPLPVDGLLYIGTNKGQLLALDPATGATEWAFKTPGAIKASPSYHAGRVFVADYQSSMFAVDAKSGKPVWRSNTSTVPPFGSGGFFSSPAIGFGHVYAARDDGNVYAFDEKTGKVDWSFPAGAAIYGSPAVAEVPGTPPTVFIGAEDGSFYALDAATGKVRWKYDVGGAVPGTAVVIGHTVYISSFETKKTIGLDVKTHRKTFEWNQAGYTPMVSDGNRLYLIGYYTVVGLEPKH